jgi:Spy/CpxP family protein refolding chaperone
MKKLIMIATIVVLLIGTVSLTVWADPGAKADRPGKGGPNGIYKTLNLTLEQQQKMLAVRQDFQKDTLVLRIDLQKRSQELRQLWAADPLSQTAIDTKTRDINTLKIQMVSKMRVMQEKIKGILTAEQLKKLNDYAQNHKFGARGPRKLGKGCRGWGF